MKCSGIDKSIEMGSGCLGDESGVDVQGMTDNRYRVSLLGEAGRMKIF